MFRIESEDIGGGGARRRQGNGRLSHAQRPAAKTGCRAPARNDRSPAPAGTGEPMGKLIGQFEC
ncbi:hypothetical protein, partial [Stenotrophomonas muris]|uniref:hypothetical protein n=1 Tax=Stenotrophomonas muris TaxID=2963283 RepID=UPI0039C652E1